jgi:Xaa-Pro aminopeptidase
MAGTATALLNRNRANDIMDREGLDGLIATSAINVYYLSDYWGPLMRMRRTFYNYAVLPRDISAPAALVLTGVELLRLHYRPDATWMPNRCGYVHPVYQDRRDFDPDVEDPEAVEHGMKWPVSPDPLNASDAQFLQYVESLRGKASVNATYALKRAVIDAGLESACVGSDDTRVGPWLNELGLPDLRVRDATTLFREIRMVKSPAEVALLRTAARINEEALESTIARVRPGMRRDELEILFNTEIARRGGRGVYLATGQRGTNNNLGLVLANETLTFDALCEYRNYHGDLGRIAYCGEPRADVVRRMKALQLGCEVVLEKVRPGVSARAMTDAVLAAIRGAGFPGFFFATPHSIGLEHSDHRIPIGPTLPGGNGEFVFEENMVFSVDMPYYEIGWGNLHLEDQLLVTRNGVEALTSCDTSLRVLPG